MDLEKQITNEQVFNKLCEVEKLLLEPKIEKGLWEIQDIADYCGLSYHHVYSNIVSDPKFPSPIDLTGNEKQKKLFFKKEVIAFFERRKRKKH